MSFSYEQYILAPSQIAKTFENKSAIRYSDADFSEQFSYKRLGIHHVTLPPHSRSSLPHAESLEEEFVFVISGQPHVWVNGIVHLLRADCAVGFAAGTGIAHCFINNTDEPVEMLVFGERTKRENLCSFPTNPEYESSILWKDAPVHLLGPHNGLPGPVQEHEIGKEWPSCIIDCTKFDKSKGWHYPGDNEVFSQYLRLTNLLQLKSLGIGYETLLPGRRSAFPHAHLHEEEFLFVLSGTATVWLNGFTYEVRSGNAAAFMPNTNVSHTIINNSSEPLHYIVLGEAQDGPEGDKIIYPQHPFRNEQCERVNALWSDRPNVKFGSHNGRPDSFQRPHLAFHFAEHPEDKPNGQRNCVLSVELNDRPVAKAQLQINYPKSEMAQIKISALEPSNLSQELSEQIYALADDYCRRSYNIKTTYAAN